jgi:hypothetical protein
MTSRGKSKDLERDRMQRLKKTISMHSQNVKVQHDEPEPEKEEKIILKKDGTPLWIIIDCQHEASMDELRL